MNKLALKPKTRSRPPMKTWESIFSKKVMPEFGPAFKADLNLRAAWRLWHLSILRQWVETDSGEEGSISCLRCGNAMGLDVEPLLKGGKDGPRKPEDGQVACLACYGGGKDFRPPSLKRHQSTRAAQDWTCTEQAGWVLKDSPLWRRS